MKHTRDVTTQVPSETMTTPTHIFAAYPGLRDLLLTTPTGTLLEKGLNDFLAEFGKKEPSAESVEPKTAPEDEYYELVLIGDTEYCCDLTTGHTYHKNNDELGAWAGILHRKPEGFLDKTAPEPLEEDDAIIQNWLKDTGCDTDKEGRYVLTPASADGKQLYTYTLSPEAALRFILYQITEDHMKSPRYGWTVGDASYQEGFHDPTLPHIQRLFELFRSSPTRTLTLQTIVATIGDKQHVNYERFEGKPEEYWKAIIRELCKQRLVIRK